MYLSLNKESYSSPNQHEACLLMCGLDAAGKTTLSNVATLNRIVQTIPTIAFHAEPIQNQSQQQSTSWDYGGRCAMRPLFRHYYGHTSALVFVVDSNDWVRLGEACEELHRMANEDELKNRPILIFANKQDLPNSQSLDVLKEKLQLSKLDEMKTKWHLQSASATKNVGINEGFEWLANAIRTKFDLTQPIIEIINDTKAMKTDLSSLWNSINLKTLFSKLV